MNNLTQNIEYLKWLKLMGIEYYFSDKKDSNILITSLKEGVVTRRHCEERKSEAISGEQGDHYSRSFEIASSATAPRNDALDSITSVEALKETLLNFNGCRLKDFAQNTVFSDGVQTAEIMLVGEAPGAKEDEKGVPFCGESGQLLDTMLATVGLSRKENIYITNTIFWRPPANRRPTKDEMEACRPFLEKHIALINPKLIVCVGSTAVAGLLGDKVNINTARSNLHHYQNQYLVKSINTMAIFHPAYLLRQPGKKKDTWFDLLKIKEFIQTAG